VNTDMPVPMMNVFCVAALRWERTQTRFQSLTRVRPYMEVSKYHSTQVSLVLERELLWNSVVKEIFDK